MVKLQIYKKQRQQFGTVGFLTDVKNQIKVSGIKDPAIFSGEFAPIITKINTLSGCKGLIEEVMKTDISDMIKSRFKHLTLDEIDYAFKLERHREYDKKTEHYNLFDSNYVAEILSKYEKWKATKRRENNLNSLAANVNLNGYVSDEERYAIMEEAIQLGKIKWLNSGALEMVAPRYDWLNENKKFQTAFNITDLQWEKIRRRRYDKVKNSHEEKLNNQKSISYSDRQSKKAALKMIMQPKSAIVILLAKKSLLIDYYELPTPKEEVIEL